MGVYKFYMPSVSVMGPNALAEAGKDIKELGFKKALIVTDKVLVKIKLVDKITDVLKQQSIDFVVFDKTQPNPTIQNVEDGLALLQN